MNIEVTKEEKNELLKRKEVEFTLDFDGPTPNRYEVRALLCKKLKAKEDLTVIDKLDQGYGTTQIKGYAKVYEDPEALKLELGYKLKRTKEPNKEEAPKEEKPVEKKEEAKKEEKPAEEKPEEKKEAPKEEKKEPKKEEAEKKE